MFGRKKDDGWTYVPSRKEPVGQPIPPPPEQSRRGRKWPPAWAWIVILVVVGLAALVISMPDEEAEPVRASARATATPKLTDLFPVKMTRCTTDEAWGTVTNRSDVAANVAVRIEWLSDSGLRLGDDTDWIFDLAPGQTAVWEVYNFTDFTPDRCDVELHDAYPS